MYAVDPEIVRAIADHSAKVHDEITQDAMVPGTKVYYGGAATSTATVAAGNVATAAMIRKAVTYLRAQGAETRDGEFYVGVVHPNVAFDLRQETGSGSWRVPNEYGSDQRKIWAGELGEFEGVRFIQNPRTRNKNDGATSTQVYRTFILGRQALAKSVIVEPQIVAGPVVDRLNRPQAGGLVQRPGREDLPRPGHRPAGVRNRDDLIGRQLGRGRCYILPRLGPTHKTSWRIMPSFTPPSVSLRPDPNTPVRSTGCAFRWAPPSSSLNVLRAAYLPHRRRGRLG